ncbi:VOC family protein [Hespellia stercorisuis]|uniref:PhnB protein n=1 Tax=Hespellia stercorisuis DSM 15480 TaxID=1121950 RepID=A0A1M6I9H3_9FIRM|nr:VOC family protein [Hespellia stercorisuis]SHJ31124.1 PhnB protein [Hespellia stercorisuis DSM 15480]
MKCIRQYIMSLCVTVQFNGNCREAVLFYARAFKQEIPLFLTYEEGKSSLPCECKIPDKMKSRVMHSRLNIAGTPVDFCDLPEAFGFMQGSNMFLSASYKEYDKAKKVFDFLKQDGEVDVPFTQTGVDKYYGILEDKFHVQWIINAQLNY